MNSAQDQKALYHEAGHAIVALRLGVGVTSIGISKKGLDRRFETILAVPGSVSSHDRCVISAGGIAAEKLIYGTWNADARSSAQDSADIAELGGGVIEDYFSEALGLLQENESKVKTLGEKLFEKYAQSFFGENPNPNNPTLMLGEEILRVWQG